MLGLDILSFLLLFWRLIYLHLVLLQLDQSNQHLSQHTILRLLIKSVAEHFTHKVLDIFRTESLVTKRLDIVLQLGFADLDKLVVAILRLVVNVDSWDVALVDQEDQQVTERNEIVTAAGHRELELVSACKDHVTAEHVHLALRLVQSLLLTILTDKGLRKLCYKAEVDDVNRCVLEDVQVLLRAVTRQLDIKVHHQIVKLEVIVNVAGRVNLLENRKQIQGKLVATDAGPLAFASLEVGLKILS